MARYDNRSINQPIVMALALDLQSAGDPSESFVFDTANFDVGYTVIIATGPIFPGVSFDVAIQTSDDSSSGFADVSAADLVGGAIPLFSQFILEPGAGDVAISRGVIDAKRFVRLQFRNFAGGGATALTAILNGSSESRPPGVPEGTSVKV